MFSSPPITFSGGPGGPLTLLFGEATQAQRLQCQILAAKSFREPLSTADYIEREEYLAQRPLTCNNGLRYWCIFSAKDPAEVFATCKTIQRDVIVRGATRYRQGKCYCIASVVTRPDFRQLGLASILLQRVADWMDGPGNATASMLFTSIGDFYAKRGWKSFPALKSTLSSSRGIPEEQDWPTRPGTKLLSQEDIPPLCARDVEEIKINFEKHVPGTKEVLIVVLPTPHLISWLHDRGDFISLKLKDEIPVAHGAMCESADSWIYWHHDFRKQALGIQRARISPDVKIRSVEAFASLLFDALEEARRWKLPTVYIWDPSPDLLQAIQYLRDRFDVEVESKEQSGSIPSVRRRGTDQIGELKLPINEHYAWS